VAPLPDASDEVRELLASLRVLAQEMLDDGDSYVAFYGKKLVEIISRAS
jgi:hypothetical protein